MKILIVGSGGREHALAWKAAQSPLAEQVFVAPGNGGTETEPGVENVAIAADDIAGLVEFARRESIDLTIVGPEAPLVLGLADAFAEAGLACFGPRRAAAQIEGSKAFAKDFLRRHGIPTADYGIFTELEPALDYLRQVGAPVVVKADGLAAGKGVILAHDQATAESAVRDMLGGRFGRAGARVVIEAFLDGEETSFIAMVDGRHILPLASSQDHKARDDGDRGPNTGGMGAYSPAPVVTPEIHERILREVMEPAVAGLATEGRPYLGFLYAGLMIGADGTPRVLEFNCRLGDPETQPLLMRLRSDLVELCLAALDGRLDQVRADWDARAALGVVMAAGGYPDDYDRGHVIRGLDTVPLTLAKVFHAGTRREGDAILTNGGRVLCVTALGATVAEAQRLAYQGVDRIHWTGAFCRHDIGYRAIAREGSRT
ncbi:phosphoribosylamine--glycine ligase [Thermochromatium tepidum]|uniref:Phosphoribosylamine--glycine ligase n=1 Tax=Thermochromatium tepidum ATCC 43061 TaxID=316276 RepID=A0A6I6E2H3_THETI|nr:phosphoribosylamine--glycine ligase [Thermochromatium tepidum]QGU31902.1 phosphoribosylamine--glycine ligase [Thermochromatium tepidum ATCC 43061]